MQAEMYYSENYTVVSHAIYQELIRFEALGGFKLFRFNEQSEESQNELIDKSAEIIVKSDFFKNDQEKLKFYKKYF